MGGSHVAHSAATRPACYGPGFGVVYLRFRPAWGQVIAAMLTWRDLTPMPVLTYTGRDMGGECLYEQVHVSLTDTCMIDYMSE